MSQDAPQTAALATREPRAEVKVGEQGVQIRSIEGGMRFAKYAVASGIVPKGDTAEAVFIKLQAGLELGFTPMRALAAVVVVNGRVSIDGKATLALIRASKVARVHVYNEGDGDKRAGVFEFERFDTGEKAKVTFTLAEAKVAGLMGKDTYKGYPDDMLAWRAVARGSKRYFSDITMGLEVGEVAHELPPATVEPPVVQREALPPSTPDPLLASIVQGEPHSHADVEVPLADPPPEMTHAEADKAIEAEELRLSSESEPAKGRHRG